MSCASHRQEIANQRGGLVSGLIIDGGSVGGGWDLKIAEASDIGIMHSAFDWRNCIAAPTSCSINLATCCSVPSFDHFSHAACAPSTPSPFTISSRNNDLYWYITSRKKSKQRLIYLYVLYYLNWWWGHISY